MTKIETVQIDVADELSRSRIAWLQSTSAQLPQGKQVIKSVVVNVDQQNREALIRRLNGRQDKSSTVVRELIAG